MGDRVGAGCMALFLCLFAIPAALTAGVLVHQAWFWVESGRWSQGSCWIDRAQLVERLGPDDFTYSNDVDYHYEFGGRAYMGTKVTFLPGRDNDQEFHENRHRELERYRLSGQPMPCLINPARPSESVLYREVRVGMIVLLILVTLVFGFVGFGGLWSIFNGGRFFRRARPKLAR